MSLNKFMCLNFTPDELDEYIRVNKVKVLPLSEFCYYSQSHTNTPEQFVEKIGIMIKHNANPNDLCPSDRTALMNNSQFPDKYSVKKCQMLINAGGNVNQQDKFGTTALSIACVSQTEFGVELCLELLRNHANPNIQYVFNGRCCALSTAIIFQSPFRHLICAHLLEYGADPNEQDSHGYTPLHHLGYQVNNLPKSIDLGDLLLDYGADPTIRDNGGRLPLEYSHVLQKRRQLRKKTKDVLIRGLIDPECCINMIDQYLFKNILDLCCKVP